MHRYLRRVRALRRRVTRAIQYDYHARWRDRPVQANTVLYESFAGNGMLCNPEAIFRYLLARPEFGHFEHIWVLSSFRQYSRTIAEFHGVPNVRFVRYRSPGYFRALATSQYLVNNATFPPEFGKRPGQTYLNTWHGTPLKHMGYDMPLGPIDSANTLRNFVSADYLVSANPFMTDTMYLSAYRLTNLYRGAIIEEGYPRIDRQRLDSEEYLATRRRLEQFGVELAERDVILYAPTWKGDSFNRPEDDIADLIEAVQAIQREVGPAYAVLLKTHQSVHRYTSGNPALRRILVPNEIPSNVILGVTSAVVTDYSSIFFDFLPTGRPIAFYTPDITDYSDTRGVYFPPSEWPGPVCATAAETGRVLTELLTADSGSADSGAADSSAAESRAARVRYQDWQERFAPFEDGEATARVVDVVFRGNEEGHRIRRAPQDERTTLLLYLGGMSSNGITSSALNLLAAIDHERYDVSVLYASSRKRQQRMNQLKIHPSVRHFPRLGGMNGSKRANIRRELAERRDASNVHRLDPEAKQLWDDEWTRCFGDSRFDVVIDYSGYSPFWETLCLHSPDARRAIWLHNDMAAEVERRVRGKQPMRRSLPRVFAHYAEFDHLVSVSPLLSDLNRTNLAAYAPAERFVAVRNLIDADRVRAGAAVDVLSMDDFPLDPETELPIIPEWALRLEPRDNTIWFVSVGRLTAEKNHSRLIRAFAAVRQERDDIGLLIVGSGPLRSQLEHEIEQLGLTDSVLLTGARHNPFAIMRTANCFVLSSVYEGQPMVLLEAAVLELPIVSTDFTSVHDALPSDSIHIVPQTDADLAEGMRAYLRGDVRPSTIDLTAYTDEVLREFGTAIGASWAHQEEPRDSQT